MRALRADREAVREGRCELLETEGDAGEPKSADGVGDELSAVGVEPPADAEFATARTLRTPDGVGNVRHESLIVLAVLAAGLVATGVGAAGTAAASRWLRWDAASRTASLTLIAGYNGANNGFNFDGYGRGRLLVQVPLRWRITVICRNAASTRHSCAVVRGPLSVAPAFPGAATPSPTLGLRGGQSARFTFTASRAGSYRIACLVPGDEQARMWDVFVVGGVTRPTISTRTGF